MNHPAGSIFDDIPSPPLYSQSIDFERLYEEYPPAPKYFHSVHKMPPHEIRALQERRFLEQVARAWRVPFYQKHWSKAGLAVGDIHCLDDIEKIPPYTVHDLRESIERNPPWGDYWGVSLNDGAKMPLVLQTSGGTTGLPRPMIYAPRDREVMSIMGARRLLMQGVRPGDLVQVTMSLGLTNAGMMVREYLWKYTGAIALTTGSGAATPTRRQIELAQAWKTTVMLGIPSYIRHLGIVARDEMKIDPRSLGIRLICCGLGPETRDALEELWGAKVMQQYGTNESGMMSAECPFQHGFHIFEDAYLLEIADPETHQPVPHGEKAIPTSRAFTSTRRRSFVLIPTMSPRFAPIPVPVAVRIAACRASSAVPTTWCGCAASMYFRKRSRRYSPVISAAMANISASSIPSARRAATK